MATVPKFGLSFPTGPVRLHRWMNGSDIPFWKSEAGRPREDLVERYSTCMSTHSQLTRISKPTSQSMVARIEMFVQQHSVLYSKKIISIAWGKLTSQRYECSFVIWISIGRLHLPTVRSSIGLARCSELDSQPFKTLIEPTGNGMDHDDLCSYIHPQQGLSPEVLDRCLSTYVCIRLKCLSNGPLTKYQFEDPSSAVECLGGYLPFASSTAKAY